MEASVAAPPSPSLAFPPKGKKMESPSFSPGSDKLFWSSLRNRVDTLLESKSHQEQQFSGEVEAGKANKRLSDDTALLLRGFDSVAHTLSQLSSNIDSALQGAKELSKPPTMTDILQSNSTTIAVAKERDQEDEEAADKGRKRKLETEHSSDNMLKKANIDSALQGAKELSKPPTMTDILQSNSASIAAAKESVREEEEEEEASDNRRKRKLETEHSSDSSHDDNMLKKAKKLAISMATKASYLAKELKSMKSDLTFTQERCVILEEENERLRREPEEDDLVRFQLEALLAEKSRLANENANLKRENQCLKQVVEYHQVTSQDLSDTYEEVINGICLDFSSPPLSKVEGDEFEFSARSEGEGCDVNENEHKFEGLLKYSS